MGQWWEYVIAISYWQYLFSEINNMAYALTGALSFTCLNIIIYFFYIDKVDKDRENASSNECHQKLDIRFNSCSGFRVEGKPIIQEQWKCRYSGSIQVDQLQFS